MSTPGLTAGDRQFFAAVAKAAFSNPFSDERVEIDRKIADDPSDDLSREELLAKVLDRISTRLHAVAGDGVKLDRFPAEDQEPLKTAVLFTIYHRYRDDFGRLIREQIKAGDEPCPVPFADALLRDLARWGIGMPESSGYLAMFYQIRRAYHFIDDALIGRSRCMKELRRRLWNNVFTHNIDWYEQFLWNRMEDFSTMLLGETGTGKGTAAAAIGRSGFIPFDHGRHRFARSFTKTFIAINLSQYPELLIESELFGHRKGAFTGAIDHHEGLLARCSANGAVFLDEIGDLSLTIQTKLLQVLQERTFSPVGGHDELRFAGRVIVATNKDLQKLRQDGRFRDDFYYRLCSDVITVPPLRQRLQEDDAELGDLIRHILTGLAGPRADELADFAHAALTTNPGRAYAWPGNVRELEQALRRILLTRSYEGDHTPAEPGLLGTLITGIEAGTLDAQTLMSSYCALLYERFGTYEEVARRTDLDRRTVKKHIDAGRP